MQKVKEGVMHALFLICACVSILAVVLICVYLFASGVPAMAEIGFTDFLFGTKWKPSSGYYGIFPMIIGSILVTGIAVVIGVPIGILCAVFMSHYCPKKLYRFVKPAINLLAGIPSIVYGFFGLVVIVPIMKDLVGGSGKSLLTAGILLGIMILPTVIKTTESSLNAVPRSYYEGALALGATHERSVFFASLPAAKSGILAAIILGVGRAIGETMAVILVAGNQTILPKSITSGIRTMTSNIVIEMGYAGGLHREALIATGVVLFVFILIINLCFSALKRRKD
ncbi:MAG: phosphate ABC transporter permease subunit PstC [Ruminococcaceae bacterium]|jgi:phosphate transport system permease protein|nr:phosphate ABC transporter permease subunit PstC [Oscillospiraceae bacterium]